MQRNRTTKKLGSYPSIGVVVSITLALFVTGLFGVLIIYSQEMERLVRENVRMQIYLKSGVTETQRLQIGKKLESLPYVNKKSANNASITFISKDEAAKKFITETGEDFTKFLGDNPLHDAYLVNVNPKYHSDDSMKRIKVALEKVSGVYQVFYVEGLIDSINKNALRIGLVLAGLVSLLLVTVVLLINNTIRLALFSQRFLVRSMQLVGAKKWFIQRPFLFRSFGYGLLSGVLASALLWSLINYAYRKIEDLKLLDNKEMMLFLMASLLLLGIMVAVVSTYFSMRRYLKMSLDELY